MEEVSLSVVSHTLWLSVFSGQLERSVRRASVTACMYACVHAGNALSMCSITKLHSQHSFLEDDVQRLDFVFLLKRECWYFLNNTILSTCSETRMGPSSMEH